MLHGNTSVGSADGGITYITSGTLQIGTLGTAPNQGINFWGTGGANPGWPEWNDVACRPDMPLAGDASFTDFVLLEDSPCLIQIGNEIQWPTAWSDTSVAFTMHRSYLDATLGAGSLAGLQLVIQCSNYTRTLCGAFTGDA